MVEQQDQAEYAALGDAGLRMDIIKPEGEDKAAGEQHYPASAVYIPKDVGNAREQNNKTFL